MLKQILVIIAMLYAAAAFAAADVNKASATELDGIKGIGPSLSGKIVEERKIGNFKDWSDLIRRVSGVGEKTAAKLSNEGLTVNGKKFGAEAKAKADTQNKKDPGGKKDGAPAATASGAAKN